MSVPELQQHGNGVWYIHWSEPTESGKPGRSRRHSTREKELSKAKIYLAQWLLMERQESVSVDVTHACADLWAVYEQRYVAAKTAAPETLRYSWMALEKHFGKLHPHEVTQEVVDEYVDKRVNGGYGRKVKENTVRRELVALRACLNWCASPRQKLISKDQVPDYELPPEGEARLRWLDERESKKLLAAAEGYQGGPRIELFVWLAMETGARKTAITQLTWDRVNFELGVIDYNVPGRMRTKKRRAVVPISDALRPVLLRHRGEAGQLVVAPANNLYRDLKVVAKRAGVAGVSPHVLRHTAATRMLSRGESTWNVAGVLATSEEMVRKVYGHFCNEALKTAVNRISGELRAEKKLAKLQAMLESGKFKLVEISE